MSLKILKQQAESAVTGGGNKLFPAGDWKFTLLDPSTYGKERIRPAPDFMHNTATIGKDKTPRIAAEIGDSEILTVWCSQAEPLKPDQPEPGDMKYFLDFVIRDGEFNIMDLDSYDDKGRLTAPAGCGWQIAKDATLLGQLALALGATVEVTQGGKTYCELAKNFVDMLKDGEFDGSTIGASIIHNTQKWNDKVTKEAKTRTDALVSRIWGI